MLAKHISKATRECTLLQSASRSLYTKPFYYDMLKLTPERKALRERVEKFAQEEIAPLDDKMDRENTFPPGLYKKMGDAGLLAPTVEKDFGGMGLGYYEQCLISEEISKASGSVGISYITHSNLCMNQIRKHGTPEQKKKFLPPLIKGEKVGALVMSEEEAGSDVVSMQLRMEVKGDKVVLNGKKKWGTNVPIASTLIIYGKTEPEKGAKGMTAIILEKGTKGFTTAEKNDRFGCRGMEQCELTFDNCEIPKENVLGTVNGGAKVLMTGLNYERLVLSALPLGIMQNCFDNCMDYVVKRKQFGKKIGEFQLIQGKLADMYTIIQTSRSFLYHCVDQFDSGKDSTVDAAAVFLHAGRNSTQVCLDGMQIFGGNGYLNKYPMGRLLRDAKVCEIGGGTTEIRQWIIGRELVKTFSS